ncbi:phosphoribosylamine--glycine ligase [Rubrivirga sp. IMCC43871]|uniref:phosphoribosylamine--glycine ligase n=1 Tax=Rubrivirga sp. IMCC43871 TaxID=3391575 RepID=UPI0039901AED
MTVLVVGGGGREHALVAALARSPRRPRLLCAPGNPGTAAHAENVAVAADDLDGLLALVAEASVDLVVVGPEIPLVAGLADRLIEADVPVVGPSRAAARLEGSKAFAKSAMERWGVPTAASRTFGLGALDEARAYVENHPLPVVLKADGLAAGKGVVVAETRADALGALAEMLEGGAFGTAGATVLVEAFLTGEEASLFVLTDGTDYVLLPAAQDHKRIGEGDTGPNTGGMGAYAPAPVVTDAVRRRVEAEVVRPVLDGMRAEGNPYRGILYVGLMIDDGAPSVVEFNCRFGDPEAQVLLPLLASDPLDLFEALATDRLAEAAVEVDGRAAACVVLASAGYPAGYESGKTITGLDRAAEHATVYHAGTARSPEGNVVTAGGRVLGITGIGDTLQAALDTAYAGADEIAFDGKTLRRDIGQKGLAR